MHRILGYCLAAALFALAFAVPSAFAEPANYSTQGGSDWEVGGTLNVKSGGTFSFGSVAQTGAVRAGVVALDGSNPTPVTSGFTSLTACTLALEGTSAPGDNTSVLTYGFSSGTLNIYGWKNTSGTDPTLVASTGTENVSWICVGS